MRRAVHEGLPGIGKADQIADFSDKRGCNNQADAFQGLKRFNRRRQ